MKPILMAALALLSPAPLFAHDLVFESAETPTTLIELFTSEGCSSCPPADAWISKLKQNPDLWKSVVPVVFHVDYWNGLGWPDRFATAANTARQRRYSATWKTNSVYTPGFVLNGREWRDGPNQNYLPTTPAPTIGKLRLALHDRTHAEVTFSPCQQASTPVQVELALLGGNLESDVKRGENSGRKLRHDFTVLHFTVTPLRLVGSQYTAVLALPPKPIYEPIAIAAWVTTSDGQPPIQATGGWLDRPAKITRTGLGESL